jgi:integrase
MRAWRLERAGLGLDLVRPDSLIFSDLEGLHLHPTHPDLPVIRLHDLRHTHATILLRKGVPVKAVSVRLGHATPMITMNVYAGWMPADDANAAAVFASCEGGLRDAK